MTEDTTPAKPCTCDDLRDAEGCMIRCSTNPYLPWARRRPEPIVLAQVEAAKATARREALLEAADAIRKAKTMPAFEAWLRLRARASAQGVAPTTAHAEIQSAIDEARNLPEFADRLRDIADRHQRSGGQGTQSSGHEFVPSAIDACNRFLITTDPRRASRVCALPESDPIHGQWSGGTTGQEEISMSRFVINSIQFDDSDDVCTVTYLDKEEALRDGGHVFRTQCVSIDPESLFAQDVLDIKNMVLDLLGDVERAFKDTAAFVPEDTEPEDDEDLGMGF